MSRSLETNILQFKMYMYIFIIKWNHQIVLHPHFSLTALLHIIHVQYLRPLTLVSVEQESYNSTVVSVFFFFKGNCPIVTEKGFLHWDPCNESLPGCPDNHYLSNEVYKCKKWPEFECQVLSILYLSQMHNQCFKKIVIHETLSCNVHVH